LWIGDDREVRRQNIRASDNAKNVPQWQCRWVPKKRISDEELENATDVVKNKNPKVDTTHLI